jgi:hypothetical protein
MGSSMKYFAIICAALFLFAGSTTLSAQGATRPKGSAQAADHAPEKARLDSIVQFLITSAANDFHAHGPAGPLRFRKVRLGHILTPEGANQYRMFGQFLQTEKSAKSLWTGFATIKTSGYEQWIGSQASSFTQDPSFRWDKTGDLSKRLQSLYDSLK